MAGLFHHQARSCEAVLNHDNQNYHDSHQNQEKRYSDSDSDMTLPVSHDSTMPISHPKPDLETVYLTSANARTFPIPRISYSLRDHKYGIMITWSILLLTTLVLPIVLYFVLKDAAGLDMSIVLAVPSALFGASSLFNLFTRCWKLLKKDSKCRPLGGERWSMDYFNFNFIIGFIAITCILIVGNVIIDPRLCALGLPLLITEVGLQLLVAAVCQHLNVHCPIRISSVPHSDKVRGGVYAISEDVIAVDSDGGREFRRQLWERWEQSEDVRKLFWILDLGWGVSGVAVGVVCIVIMFAGVMSEDAAYVAGWAVPWGFAVVGGLTTLMVCKRYLRKERLDGNKCKPRARKNGSSVASEQPLLAV